MSGFLYGFINQVTKKDLVTTPLNTIFNGAINGILYCMFSRNVSNFLPHWFKLIIPIVLSCSVFRERINLIYCPICKIEIMKL